MLDLCVKPMPKLCTLVAYYPDVLPAPAAGFPPSLNVVVHLAGEQRKIHKYRSYSYPEAEVGFAEGDLEDYDKVSAGLAWSRTLAAVRKGFEIEVDLEKVWEEHVERECFRSQVVLRFLVAKTRGVDSRVCKQRCRRNNGYHGRRALR